MRRSIEQSNAIRLAVALIWFVTIGALMYAGAAMLGLPEDQQGTVAIMGGLGAAACIFFFAGRW